MELGRSTARQMLDDELLKNLCCPETRQDLQPAQPELITRLNQRINAGTLKNRAGEVVSQPIDDGLVRADGQWLYPIRNNIPILLIDQALSTDT
jgi:uncharacterized protein YbaR (Trm112 family)